jgi:hypothetical protein
MLVVGRIDLAWQFRARFIGLGTYQPGVSTTGEERKIEFVILYITAQAGGRYRILSRAARVRVNLLANTVQDSFLCSGEI